MFTSAHAGGRAPPPPLVWSHGSIAEHHIHTPEALKQFAQLIWARTWRYREKLCEPDAWLVQPNNRVVFSRAEASRAASPDNTVTPLCPGDELVYFGVIPGLAAVHRALYVGRGFVIGLTAPHISESVNRGTVVLESLGGGNYAKRAWQSVVGALPSHVRLARLWRALSSVGEYHYSAAVFNCQHMFSAWDDNFAEAVSVDAVCVVAAVVAVVGGAGSALAL